MASARLFGLLDIAALVCITLVFFNASPGKAVLWVAFYLVIKGLAFRWDFNSWIDMGIGAYALLLAFGVRISVVYVFILLYLGQKGMVSLA